MLGVEIFIATVVSLIEFSLTVSWNRSYFRFGFPLFYSRVHSKSTDLKSDHFEGKFSSRIFPHLIFKTIDKHNIGFRERFYPFSTIGYAPIMHGLISEDKNDNAVIIRGYMNWSMAVIILIFCNFARWNHRVLSVVALIFGSIYLIQVYRYRKIVEYIEDTG